MDTIFSQKAYQSLVEKQAHTDAEIFSLKRMVQSLAQDEISSTYANKLERVSMAIDKGKGKRFSSAKKFSLYLNAL